MPEEHPHLSHEILQRYLRAELSYRDMHEVVRHLLDCCPQCLELALEIGRAEGFRFVEGDFQSDVAQQSGDAYCETFMEALRSPDETAMKEAQDKLRGIGLWASLERRPQEVRLVLLRSDPRFRTWGFFERLLEKCRQAAFVDPIQSVDLAHLALAVIEAMETGGRSPALADGQSCALGLLGNAKRLAADFQGSEQAFRDAAAALAEGTRDPREEANLLCLQASLWRDLGEFEEAVAILDQAIAIYRGLGEPHLEGRALLKLADSLGHIEPGKGIQAAQEALALIDPSREPRLDLCGRHALAWFLNDAGQPREALTLLEISRPLYSQFSDPWTRIRLHWLEGRICRNFGDLPAAESIFLRLQDDLQSRSYAHELTLLSLDLAEVYVAQEKHEAAQRLIQGLLPQLQSWGMHQEGLAVWLLLLESMRKGSVRTAAFQQISEYIHRAWHRPLQGRQGSR